MLIVCVFVLSPLLTKSQDTTAVKFSGSNKLNGEYATRKGFNSEVPAAFLRDELNMSLSVYELPINARFFVTTEQQPGRQWMDMFQIYISPQQYLSSIKKKAPPAFSKIFGMFSTLEFGTCHPGYSQLIINGISVRGVNIEINPGLFYAAFSAGRTKKAIEGSVSQRPAYQQDLILGRLGIGKRNSTHFYLTFMRVHDKVNSIQPDSIYNLQPEENYILGSELNFILFKKKLEIKGEGAASLFTRDIRSPALMDFSSDVPEWVTGFFDPKISTSLDFAYSVNALLKLKTTQLNAGVKKIGPGYKSLGTPYLRNDLFLYDFKITQALFKRNINLQAYFQRNFDNVNDWKSSTTYFTSFGVNATFRFKDKPYFILNYSPYYQEGGEKPSNINNDATLISFTSGYNYKIGEINSYSNIYYAFQNNVNRVDTITGKYTNHSITLNESLKFKIPLTIVASLGWSKSDFTTGSHDIISSGLKGIYGEQKKWRNSLAISYNGQVGEKNKIRINYTTTFKIWKLGTMNIEFQEGIFRSDIASSADYNESIIRCYFLTEW